MRKSSKSPSGGKKQAFCDSAKKTAMTDVVITDQIFKFHRKTTKPSISLFYSSSENQSVFQSSSEKNFG